MRRAIVAVGVAACLATSACASDSEPLSASGLRVSAARQLQSEVLALAQSAASKDWTAARTAVAALRADLSASRSSGAISSERATQIEATVADIVRELPAVPAATQVPTSRTTTKAPTTQPAGPAKKRHGRHGDG